MSDDENKKYDRKLLIGYILWIPAIIALYFVVQWVQSW